MYSIRPIQKKTWSARQMQLQSVKIKWRMGAVRLPTNSVFELFSSQTCDGWSVAVISPPNPNQYIDKLSVTWLTGLMCKYKYTLSFSGGVVPGQYISWCELIDDLSAFVYSSANCITERPSLVGCHFETVSSVCAPENTDKLIFMHV